MKRAFLWAILLSAIAAVFAASALSGLKRERTIASQPEADPSGAEKTGRIAAPSFTLTDQKGRSFNSKTLRGRVWIADFIFTSCAGSCPRMSAQMSLLQKRLPAAIQFVSITVDPKRDNPRVLAEYARKYGAQADRWHFLTGPADDIARIVQQGFRLSYGEGGGPEEPVTHSSRFVLVDRSGSIRGYYDSTEPEQLRQLEEDAKILAR